MIVAKRLRTGPSRAAVAQGARRRRGLATDRRWRLWLGGVLAGVAVAAALGALAVPFLGFSAGAAAGYAAGLLIVAEVLAAGALLVLGKELYRALRAKLDALRSSLDER